MVTAVERHSWRAICTGQSISVPTVERVMSTANISPNTSRGEIGSRRPGRRMRRSARIPTTMAVRVKPSDATCQGSGRADVARPARISSTTCTDARLAARSASSSGGGGGGSGGRDGAGRCTPRPARFSTTVSLAPPTRGPAVAVGR